jgi:hypothetical protein
MAERGASRLRMSMFRMSGFRMSEFRRRYGAGPWHLISLLLCFLVAGYAVLRWLRSPSEIRLLVWFAGALIAHDFVLFPLYSAIDRAVGGVARERRPRRVPLVNHVRVPLVLSGLLLLLWFPLILNKQEPAYRAATGLDTTPFRNRYLVIVAVCFGVSALIYGIRLLLAARSSGASRSGAVANSAIPAAKSTEADQPSS